MPSTIPSQQRHRYIASHDPSPRDLTRMTNHHTRSSTRLPLRSLGRASHESQRPSFTIGDTPTYTNKTVYMLSCRGCSATLCKRAMKAVLLGDTRIELFSTDVNPGNDNIALISEPYLTNSCQCSIRDIACVNCGNCVGYHVAEACESCLQANNNAHYYIFSVDEVTHKERYLDQDVLTWSAIPSAKIDLRPVDDYVLYCR